MTVQDLLAPPDDRAVETALEAYAAAARQRYGTKLVGLYLFGSRARGDFKPFSDVDVAVVVAGEDVQPLGDVVALSGLAYDVLLETGAEIQPWLFREVDWEDPSHSESANLIRSAKRDSRVIWVPS